jgi:hypothetical protein
MPHLIVRRSVAATRDCAWPRLVSPLEAPHHLRVAKNTRPPLGQRLARLIAETLQMLRWVYRSDRVDGAFMGAMELARGNPTEEIEPTWRERR